MTTLHKSVAEEIASSRHLMMTAIVFGEREVYLQRGNLETMVLWARVYSTNQPVWPSTELPTSPVRSLLLGGRTESGAD